MKNTIRIFLLILLASSSCNSIKNNQKSSLLWEISGNGLQEPSYLFGTIHIICPEDFVMTDKIKASFAKTKQLYLELDFDDPLLMLEMQKRLMLPEGESIKDFLSDEDYQLINNFLQENSSYNLTMFNQLKPVGIMSMLLTSMPFLNCKPKSYENEFAQMAAAAEIDVKGLETVAYQMGIFDKIPTEYQLDMIIEMIKEKDVLSTEYRELIKVYKEQDISMIQKLIKISPWNFSKYENLLIYNRNKEWISRIEEAAQGIPSFFAVGAAHLGGEEGLLELLKAKGYKLKPIR